MVYAHQQSYISTPRGVVATTLGLCLALTAVVAVFNAHNIEQNLSADPASSTHLYDYKATCGYKYANPCGKLGYSGGRCGSNDGTRCTTP